LAERVGLSKGERATVYYTALLIAEFAEVAHRVEGVAEVGKLAEKRWLGNSTHGS
jgi:hypothetical protein